MKLACLWITEVIHVLVWCAQLKELLLLPKVCVKTQEPQLVTEQLNVSCTSLRRILHKDLGLFAYKLQLTQELVASFALTLAAEISSYYYQLQEKSREKKFRREELKLATVVKWSFE
ncbi:hypothetical protein NQ318_019921 [Aromia moschata]|uniref:Uncharacterized protein n=1 Tax=Aromia moschata TaxID=1265417 RepID=A0AAV8Y8Y5_9CUCU|nr:hypothetical protein NQ318_019921 [Aromia moschata]